MRLPGASLVAAVALTAFATACSSRPAGSPSASGVASGSSPRASAGDGEPGDAASSAGGASARARAGATGGTAAAEVSSLLPRPGLYRYRQSGATKAGTFTIEPDPEGTLEVAAATDARRGRRQHQTRTYSDNEQMEQVLLFREDAVLLEQTTQRYAGQEVRCRTEDPLVVLRIPLEVGASWKDRDSCEGLEISFSIKVLRSERREVGGTRTDTFVLRYTASVSGDGYEQTTTSTTWLSPEHGLIVRSVEESKGSARGIPISGERTEELLSLTPGS